MRTTIIRLSESKRLRRFVESTGYPTYYDALNHWIWGLNSFFIKSLGV